VADPAAGPSAGARPPADIAPGDFFERWLPDAYAAAGGHAPADSPAVRVTLSGPAGGEWRLRPEGSRLAVERVAPGPPARGATPPLLWIRQSAADFLAAFSADPDLPVLLPAGFGPLDMLFLDPRDLELVRQIDGRLLLELAGRRRRRWALDLAAGKAGLNAGRARATVRLDAATYEGLAAGSVPPLQALLERRIAVEGDRALAMQALMLLGARLTRR
jgi:hypothetical protein